MRSQLLLCAVALTACSKLTSLASFEGKITMHTSSAKAADAQGGRDMVVDVKGDKLRFDMENTGNPTHAVYDPAGGTVQVFFDGPKKYMDMDFSAPGATPNTNPASAAIEKSGTHRMVAGYDCEQWSVKDASGRRSEVCIAQGIAFFDVSSLRAAGKTESPLAKEFREHKSFPLESIEYDATGAEVSRMVVTKIDKQKLDDALFAVPAGYAKVDVPMR